MACRELSVCRPDVLFRQSAARCTNHDNLYVRGYKEEGNDSELALQPVVASGIDGIVGGSIFALPGLTGQPAPGAKTVAIALVVMGVAVGHQRAGSALRLHQSRAS